MITLTVIGATAAAEVRPSKLPSHVAEGSIRNGILGMPSQMQHFSLPKKTLLGLLMIKTVLPVPQVFYFAVLH